MSNPTPNQDSEREQLKTVLINKLYDIYLRCRNGRTGLLDSDLDFFVKLFTSQHESWVRETLKQMPKKKRKKKTNGMRGEQYKDENMEYGRPGDGYNQALKEVLSLPSLQLPDEVILCDFCHKPATKMNDKPSDDYPISYNLCDLCSEKHKQSYRSLKRSEE